MSSLDDGTRIGVTNTHLSEGYDEMFPCYALGSMKNICVRFFYLYNEDPKHDIEEHFDKDNLYHNENGPARVRNNGTVEYLFHGEFHREDGPAIKTADGRKYYFLHGVLHREDGPAIETPDGKYYLYTKRTYKGIISSVISMSREYYFNGEYLTEEDHIERVFMKRSLNIKRALRIKG